MISTGIVELARAGRKNELNHAKLLNQLLISVLLRAKKPLGRRLAARVPTNRPDTARK